MLEELPGISLINKKLCFITPILSLIRLLAREGFCDALGHPIGSGACSLELSAYEKQNKYRKQLSDGPIKLADCTEKNNWEGAHLMNRRGK
jgi:hypothetical protein